MESEMHRVEKHERVLFGTNGMQFGLIARVTNMETFIEELRDERKEAKGDRRKIMQTVVAGILIQIIVLVGVLVWTHPAVAGAIP